MVRRIGWVLLVGLAFAMIAVGCDCGPSVAICSEDKDCESSRLCESATNRCACQGGSCKPVQCLQDFHCAQGQKCVKYQCTGNDRCTKDEDCPNGGTCNVITGQCSGTCQTNSECTDQKVCCDLDDSKGKQCNFNRCLKHEDCRIGSKNTCVEPLKCDGGILSSCIQGACKCEIPCGGGDCGAGKCCDVAKNACTENPAPCPDLKCPDGSDPPAAADFTVDPKSCKLTGPECKCVKREPLPLGDVGKHSEIALFNSQPVISAYNETYGDLMVGFKQGDGTLKWEFVDGLPTAGKPSGDPAGPRGGVKEPGDDVGLHTSIVAAAGVIHVSYYDATNGALKYARKEADKWESHTVDKAGSLIGRFTSITIDNGVPVIAYYVGNDGKGKSQLRVARGSSGTPKGESDWVVLFADSVDLPACKGVCDASKKEVCVKQGTTFSCKVPTAAFDKCAPKACAQDTEACVNGACLPIEADDPNPAFPRGTGLFPSIAPLTGGGIVIAYYAGTTGDLKVAHQKGGGNFTVLPLKTTGDIGHFPSVAVGPNGDVHISYINNDTADVQYLQLDSNFKIKVDEIVDDGIEAGEDRLLADTSIAVDPGGTVRIVYQDASVQALKMASRRGPKQWEAKSLASGEDTPYTGAYGFFADQIISGNTSHISNFKFNLKDKNGVNVVDLRMWP